MAPTHEITASGDPMASCSFSREPRVNSFLAHDTCFVQSSPLHHSGTSPVLETDTTSTEDEEVASAWHTRLPTNPVPPRTVTFSADAAETSDKRHRRRIEGEEDRAGIDEGGRKWYLPRTVRAPCWRLLSDGEATTDVWK